MQHGSEAGAWSGMVAVDEKTIEYVIRRRLRPRPINRRAAMYWRTLVSATGATFDRVVEIDAATIEPQVTWGISPEMVTGVRGTPPKPEQGIRSGQTQRD